MSRRPIVLGGVTSVLAQAQAQEKTSPFATELGKEFASETATVNGITDRQEATSYFVRIAQHNEA